RAESTDAGRMERRRERGALSAGGDVAAAEIAHDPNAAPLRQERSVHELHGIAAVRPVPDGLPVTADRLHSRGIDACLDEQRLHGSRAELRERVTERGRALELALAGGAQRERFRAQRGRIGVRMRRERTPWRALEID